MTKANNTKRSDLDELITGMRGPIPADVEIPVTPEIVRDQRTRTERIAKMIGAGLETAREAGAPFAQGFSIAVQAAIASEVEHMKQEILLELDARERRQIAAAALAAKERGQA